MFCGLIDEVKNEWGNYVLHNFPICIKDVKPERQKQISYQCTQISASTWDITDFKRHYL
jgi:hypothetical protein